jgi:hypothetical protein
MSRPDRDQVVAEALDAIETPPHGEGFWERLDDALDGVAPLPAHGTTDRTVRFRTAAAVAAALMLLATAVVLSRGTEPQQTTVGDDVPGTAPAPTSPPAGFRRVPPDVEEKVRRSVEDFLLAMAGLGELRTRPGPRTRLSVRFSWVRGNEFVERLSLNWGPWGRAAERRLEVLAVDHVFPDAIDAGQVNLALVVLHGPHDDFAGKSLTRPAVLPVVLEAVDGSLEWVVDPDAGNPETVVRESRESACPLPHNSSDDGTVIAEAGEDVSGGSGPAAPWRYQWEIPVPPGQVMYLVDDGNYRSVGGEQAHEVDIGPFPPGRHLVVGAVRMADGLVVGSCAVWMES